jgi:hypothetical protein
MLKRVILSIISLSLLACSTGTISDEPYVDKGVKGGLAGGIIGSGTGAIIGATISNGDVVASTLLGGGIGLPVGVALGLIMQSNNEESELAANNKIIESNYQSILDRQRQIDNLREEIEADYKSIKLDKEKREYLYTGEILGNYQR